MLMTGPWRKNDNKTVNSIIPRFMSPFRDGLGALRKYTQRPLIGFTDVTIINRKVPPACSILIIPFEHTPNYDLSGCTPSA